MRGLLSAFALGSIAFANTADAAVLLGATISEQYLFPDLGTPYIDTDYFPQTFVVGAGEESEIVLEGVTTFNVDFSDTSLGLDFDTVLSNPTFGPGAFNGLVFTSSAFAQLTGATVNAASNLAGFDASRVTLAGNELRLDWTDLSYNSSTVVALDFASSPNRSGVPEPSTWAMMLVGFGAISFAMRKRQHHTLRCSFA